MKIDTSRNLNELANFAYAIVQSTRSKLQNAVETPDGTGGTPPTARRSPISFLLLTLVVGPALVATMQYSPDLTVIHQGFLSGLDLAVGTRSPVGILIATNIIKSAPATKFVGNVVRSLDLLDVPDAPVVIAVDRTDIPSRKAVEEEYIQNLKAICKEERRPCHVEPSPKGQPSLGLLDNTVHSLDRLGPVEYVLVLQGDTPFVVEVPLLKVVQAMKPLDMDYVRMTRWEVGTHEWGNHDCKKPELKKEHKGLNFTATNIWSDTSHLVPIDYYRRDFMVKNYHTKTYPEYFMVDLKKQGTGCGDGKMYEYGQIGDAKVTDHKDGREHEEKLWKKDIKKVTT